MTPRLAILLLLLCLGAGLRSPKDSAPVKRMVRPEPVPLP